LKKICVGLPKDRRLIKIIEPQKMMMRKITEEKNNDY
jgi:hypothetical protein